MELIYCEKLTQQAHLDGVWRLLRDYDKAFIPPLSNRLMGEIHSDSSTPWGIRSTPQRLASSSLFRSV